jgi:hypothetical protein
MNAPRLPSKRASSFKKLYAQLPEKVQHEADEAYRQFKTDPDAHGLNFKQIIGAYYSARVGSGHRALAVRRTDCWLWFWIGSHADYDKFLDQLRRGRQGI